MKKIFKERKPADRVNIDGKDHKWGDFVNKTYAEYQDKANKGEIITENEFIMNKGDPKKEKLLFWNYKTGFISENSDDELTSYKRLER